MVLIMNEYKLSDFLSDLKINSEFDFTHENKIYTLSISREEYIFTDAQEQVYCIYASYDDLLKSVRIKDLSIEEIIDKKLYSDLSRY